ncbi:serine hydrolase [Phenylobacterium sp.]|uniref:serine hydrolase domain-containing protein n=1 Tax=Phenylobacterium sp. TaxID=1871053 RepID=UPI00121BA455|nr:serine hydrolase domain-containing protein [Phenylobacterium sp.]THD58428.1 MAG: class A beta-lactamase-related serine hydrolase [Phenylobacterium sp.]
MGGKGFTAEGLSGIGAALRQGVDSGFTPGLAALVDRGGQTEVFTVGHTGLDGEEPMRRDSIFRIASMTKLVTATAVMMLAEEGKLRLDEPVDRLAPELADRRVLRRIDGPLDDTVPARRPITVEDTLTYRLGWGIQFDPDAPIIKAVAELEITGFGMPDPLQPFGVDEWLKRLGTLPLMRQPGEAWLYTTGSDLQAALVERASGMAFDDFVRERITEPLGMADTGFFVTPQKQPRLGVSYRPEDRKLVPFDAAGAQSRYARRPRFPEGDSGLTSTVDDLLAFSRMLLAGGEHGGKRLLSEASVAAMTTNHLPQALAAAPGAEAILGQGHGWGYGMSVLAWPSKDGLRPGAFGWSGGFGTSWYLDPAEGLTTIILTPRLFDSPDPPALHKAFWAAAYAALA